MLLKRAGSGWGLSQIAKSADLMYYPDNPENESG